MFGRDKKGNTEEEVYDLFFEWADAQIVLPLLFDDLPELSYSDLIATSTQMIGDEYYGDIVFDLWKENVYNKN